MKGGIPIGKIKGIKVYIHWTFFILLFWIGGSKFIEDGDLNSVASELGFILSVFACVLLHEFGHALTAARYGVKTKDITLLPIGGVARLEKMPELPIQEFYVAIMGPMVNVIIVVLLWILIQLGKGFPIAFDFEDFGENGFLVNLGFVNLSLIVFNLIPAFPMDGGRVLRSLLAMKWSREKATRIAVSIGQSIAVLFVVAGFFYNPFLILIGVFVFLGAQSELKIVQKQSAFKGVFVKNIMIRDFIVLDEHSSLKEASSALLQGYSTEFLVKSGEVIVGVVTRNQILRGFAQYESTEPISTVMTREIFYVSPDDEVSNCWLKMKAGNLQVVPVYSDSILIGILTNENITEYYAMHVAMQEFR